MELQSDAQVLIQALYSKKHDLSASRVLFHEIKFMLSSCFTSFSLSSFMRSCNKVALWLTLSGVWRKAGTKSLHCLVGGGSILKGLVASDSA